MNIYNYVVDRGGLNIATLRFNIRSLISSWEKAYYFTQDQGNESITGNANKRNSIGGKVAFLLYIWVLLLFL